MTTSAVGAGNETGTETGTDGNTIGGVDSVEGDGSGKEDGGDEPGGGEGLDGGDGTDGVETETCAHSRATYEHEGHKKIEGTIIVKEVRGNFGKEKWDKAEIKEMMEHESDGKQRTYPIRFINSISFTDTDGGQGTFKAH
ncbi:hypothetical protein P5673_025926 [Acropora cervicornis]|uniref:Uncharacterized protein n=1 Tax=Acropora cervicornis TaxID=6130 RepID=A0AAD9Q1R4_ACRCE|nr:hypothetical protein P5673_025926 [Acropora cervicornis]